jgi:hypothetical protein
MNGSEKLRLEVIGKYANPRCFKNINYKPTYYYNNSKVWMRSDIFKEILSKLNRKFVKENRHVLLFLDNCGANPKDLNFSNIKMTSLS